MNPAQLMKFIIAIFAASAIKCYTCASKKDVAECNAQQKEQDCGGSFDRCAKISLDFKVANIETKMYTKGCSTKAVCDGGNDLYKNCKKIDGAKCDLSCCEGDLCNGGTAQVVSVFLMVACALMVLLH